MDLPAFQSYSSSEPEEFYLGIDPEFASLADTTIVAEDTELPAHSQILSLHSGVLKSLFATVHEGGAGAVSGRSPCWPCGAAQCAEFPALHAVLLCLQVEDGIYMKDAFSGCSLYAVAAFLRFLYQPEDACAANFKQVLQRMLVASPFYARPSVFTLPCLPQLGDALHSLVRLSHRLDCRLLLSKLDTYLSDEGAPAAG